MPAQTAQLASQEWLQHVLVPQELGMLHTGDAEITPAMTLVNHALLLQIPTSARLVPSVPTHLRLQAAAHVQLTTTWMPSVFAGTAIQVVLPVVVQTPTSAQEARAKTLLQLCLPVSAPVLLAAQ